MKQGPALENLTGAIIEICRSGLAPDALRDQALARLRRAVSFDAAYWATVDPATLLATQPHQHEIPRETVPYFVENEYLDDDVNKWTTLVRDSAGVRTLSQATAGDLEASPRYRDIFRPLGFGDELRAVLRVGGVCWGCICLHREAGSAFSKEETLYVRRIAPHLAEGIRAGLLVSSIEMSDASDSPGLVLLAADGTLVAVSEPGERWLAELRQTGAGSDGVPDAIRLLTARLQVADGAELPRLPVRTARGRWAILHASLLPAGSEPAMAVIIEEPTASELAPILMMAYGLTKQEQAITELVCRGLSTRELADRLHITPNTLQDHLKSIFDKTGVRSRRELVVTILKEQYRPRVTAGRAPGPAGFFA